MKRRPRSIDAIKFVYPCNKYGLSKSLKSFGSPGKKGSGIVGSELKVIDRIYLQDFK